MHKGGNHFYLIALHMSDHMPANIAREHLLLLHQLLHLVLPEIPVPRLVCLHDRFRRMGLTDGYQQAIRVFEGAFYLFKVFCYMHLFMGHAHMWAFFKIYPEGDKKRKI